MSNIDSAKSTGQIFNKSITLVAGLTPTNGVTDANWTSCSQVLGIQRTVLGGVVASAPIPKFVITAPAVNAVGAALYTLSLVAPVNTDTSTYVVYWTNNVASSGLACPFNPTGKLAVC